jgi:hypothetical protein
MSFDPVLFNSISRLGNRMAVEATFAFESNVRSVPAIAVVSRFVSEVKRAEGYPPKKRVPDT